MIKSDLNWSLAELCCPLEKNLAFMVRDLKKVLETLVYTTTNLSCACCASMRRFFVVNCFEFVFYN